MWSAQTKVDVALSLVIKCSKALTHHSALQLSCIGHKNAGRSPSPHYPLAFSSCEPTNQHSFRGLMRLHLHEGCRRRRRSRGA